MAKPSIVIGDGKFATKDTKFLGYVQGDSSSRFVARELDFDRGSNISASRVLPSGLVEKGRVLYAINTTWEGAAEKVKPTGWNDVQNGYGTYFPVQGSSGHIKFEITGPDSSSDRYFLQSAGVATTSAGIYATSVYVEAVTGTAPRVRDVVLSVVGAGNTKTDIGHFKNDTEAIESTERVEAGNRYTFVAHLSATGYHRFGIGTNSDVDEVGSVTLSRPQIETGMSSTPYRENTGSSVVNIGILEDEARIDYSDNSNGALLLEPTRQNEIIHSEYFGHTNWVNASATRNIEITHMPNEVAPDGSNGCYKIKAITANNQLAYINAITAQGTYTNSIFIKRVSGTTDIKFYDINNNSTDFSLSEADGWKRIAVSATGTEDTGTTGRHYINFGAFSHIIGDEILVWGAQQEEGAFATSYIPTYGAAATRASEGLPALSGSVIDMSSFMKGDDVTIVVHWADNPTQIRDSSTGGIRLSNGDAQSGSIRFYRNGDSALQLRAVFFGTDGNNNSVSLASSTPKVAISRVRSTGVFTVYLDGSPLDVGLTDANGQFTNSNFDVTWDDLQISGGNQQKILLVKVFDSALTNSEMANETS